MALGRPQERAPSPKRKDEPPSAASQVDVTWSTPAIDGDPPSARGGHSAVLAGEMLFVFGGHYFGSQGKFVYLNDLHRLDLAASAWGEVVFPKRDDVVLPRPRYNHSALLLNGGSRMFVFGGKGEGALVLRDMFFLDLAALAWFQVQWTTDCPTARFGHGVASVNDATMVVFGGWDGKASMNDLWTFDSTTFTWHHPKCSGKPPTPRQDLSMERVVDSDTMLIYGGYTVVPGELPMYNKDVYLFNAATKAWSRPRLVGEYPLATFGQSLCAIGDMAILLGGWSGTERTPLFMGDKQVRELAKMMAREERLASGQEESKPRKRERTQELRTASSYARALDVHRLEWFRIRSSGVEVPNRYGHTATLVGPHIFIFGGWDGNRALHQLVVGEISAPNL